MKTIKFCLTLSFILSLCSLQAASNATGAAQTKEHALTDEKFNLMERDENEDSDTLAIPFDDSEVEDEEEINEAEKKEVFPLPKD